MLSQYELLTSEECTRARNIIHSLKSHWVNRAFNTLPFYTLGTASYLDASKENTEKYFQVAERMNPLLKTNFPMLYERLLDQMATILDQPVSYAEGLALPGFHIFLANKVFENSIASVHFDLQFEGIKWRYDEVDFAHPISFTCPIVLPKGGAGLNYWKITNEEAQNLSKVDLEELKTSRGVQYFPYELGKLVLHKGLLLHQIAPAKDMQPGDERITLQGHGLLCDGIMRLYW